MSAEPQPNPKNLPSVAANQPAPANNAGQNAQAPAVVKPVGSAGRALTTVKASQRGLVHRVNSAMSETQQQRFLAYSVILEEGGSSVLLRASMFVMSIVVIAFVAWSAITIVDETSSAFGEVLPSGSIRKLQHLEGGVVDEILVEEGQLVEAGAVLVKMQAAGPTSEIQTSEARLVSLLLQIERLQAFGMNREPNWALTGHPEAALIQRYPDMVQNQKDVFESALKSLESQREILRLQIQQQEADLALYAEQRGSLQANVGLMRKQVALRQKLYDDGLGSLLILLDVQRQLNTTINELTRLDGQNARVAKELAEGKQKLIELEDRLRKDAINEMGKLDGELNQVRESLVKLADRFNRLEIKAPVMGIIKGLAVSSNGSVITPGGVVTELVPMSEEMVVEAKLSVKDIGHVRVGHPVKIKVVTYDYARYGGIEGEVKSISATTFLDPPPNNQPFYKVKVKVYKNYVGSVPGRNVILPGMTVQADIKTGSKTLLQYLIKPIYNTLSEAFSER